VDALEERLGVKLFQRHARGYAPTEAGQDLARIAAATDDQFMQLSGRLRGHGASVTGELIVTSLLALSPVLVPAIASFQQAHPQLAVRYITDERLFRLEYGEAHVAIRAGHQAPDEPDNVVQPFTQQHAALFASPAYIEEYGMPDKDSGYAGHRFIGHDDPENRAPFNKWLRTTIPPEQIVFRCGDTHVQAQAIRAGIGLGCLPLYGAIDIDGLINVSGHEESWSAPLWLVTHVDLHRTAKVQSFLKHLKALAQEIEAQAAVR
jgi:DNA-binding transcriptional LysR family regulator